MDAHECVDAHAIADIDVARHKPGEGLRRCRQGEGDGEREPIRVLSMQPL